MGKSITFPTRLEKNRGKMSFHQARARPYCQAAVILESRIGQFPSFDIAAEVLVATEVSVVRPGVKLAQSLRSSQLG